MSAIDVDVAIVGGGLIGCMTAFALCKRGRSVVVLERGRVGGESSGVSFGSLRLQGQHAVELPLALRAHEIWETIEEELGESIQFARHGHVHLALNDEHRARLESNARHGRAHGMDITLLDREMTLRRWPFLSDKVVAASWSTRDAVVNPRLVAPAFARAARRLGATIHEGIEVARVEQGGGRFIVHGRMRDGSEPVISSAALVNAAGAWSDTLAAQFGETIPLFAAGPAELVTEPIPPFAAPVMHVVDGSILFRQTDRGNVIIAGHPRMKVDAETRRARVPPDKILINLARLVAIVPRMRAHAVIRSWTGIEGYVEDMMPVLGPSSTTPGLYHACAFSGHGLQMGPAAAVAIAELIADGATTMPIAPFDIRRFYATGQQRTLSLAEEFQADVLPPRDGLVR
ncbi:FAD-binding oxidoreductase [Elioraea sp.]|uniref:NAD(P)/FAD-dependent oxidoreductase n=1 Tax=Elioraea sp. TaxID=2185103 RepID=UPI0025B8DA7F|nr:FAD-dependent oxidoreductase [Elioraea sp.]